jgi:hypothetical protein
MDAIRVHVQMQQVSCQVSHGLGPNLLLSVVLRLLQINDAGPLNFCHKISYNKQESGCHLFFSLPFKEQVHINRMAEEKLPNYQPDQIY